MRPVSLQLPSLLPFPRVTGCPVRPPGEVAVFALQQRLPRRGQSARTLAHLEEISSWGGEGQSANLASEEPRALRVLCLHGYGQNGRALEALLRDVAAEVQADCQFVFLDAPFAAQHQAFESSSAATATPGSASQADGSLRRCWWRARQLDCGALVAGDGWDSEDKGKDNGGTWEYCGWSESVHEIISALERTGPVDGVLGFSQGACMAAALAATLALASTAHSDGDDKCNNLENGAGAARLAGASAGEPQWRLRFGLFVSGFCPRDQDMRMALEQGFGPPKGAASGSSSSSSSCSPAATVARADEGQEEDEGREGSEAEGFLSLHIMGQRDRVVPPSAGLALAALLPGGGDRRADGGSSSDGGDGGRGGAGGGLLQHVLWHQGGHSFPRRGRGGEEVTAELAAFLRRQHVRLLGPAPPPPP